MSYVKNQQQQQFQQNPQDSITTQTVVTQVPTYETQITKPDQINRGPQIILQSQSMHQNNMEDQQENHNLTTKVMEHNELNDSVNSTIEREMDATSNDHNNDSFEGNGADDECDEPVSVENNADKESGGDIGPTDGLQTDFEVKSDGRSNKYPILKVYYEYGPWVGRNRKAICIRCRHTSASSQPERLIRHLRRCTALSDEDRQIAEDLLVVSNANKKKRKSQSGDGDETDYYAEDDNNKSTDQSTIISLPTNMSGKRIKRDHPDRKKHIDQCLVRFIVCNRIPLKSVHSKEFIEFVRAMDPEYRLPSRETITNTLIPGLLNI